MNRSPREQLQNPFQFPIKSS
ncbi:hypothetical protein F383_20414 [Gossypium arboreum]|uniref:Uncharacterized protein n=1 Tax=Gossypium arboreum TaxID=29729 RepID=A0A0B0MII3_GOSAR|nr:hypothetical protein F383_20414 [Gossypium arboreum]